MSNEVVLNPLNNRLELYQFVEKFYSEIKLLCKPDVYNLVLHKHLGDVFYAVAAAEAFEATYNKKLHFIVRSQHAFVMQMYNKADYSIFDFSEYEKYIIDQYYRYLPYNPHNNKYAFDVFFQDAFVQLPIKDIPFAIDSHSVSFLHFDDFWCYRWMTILGFDIENFSFPLPNYQLAVSNKLTKKLAKIAPLDQVVLFAPEASTATELPCEFWGILAEKVQRQGYKIIVNSNRYQIKNSFSTFDLHLSLEEVVALGLNCAYVFSLRSGLCDVLVGAGERLYAFYPAILHREIDGLNQCFEPNSKVNEIAIWRWKIDPVVWKNHDLTPTLQQYIDKLQYSFIRYKIKYILSFLLGLKVAKLRAKFRYRQLRNMAGVSKVFAENNKANCHQHRYYNQNISLFKLPIYSRRYTAEKRGHYTIRYKLLGGLLQLKTFDDKEYFRVRLLGLPLLSKTVGKIKLLGITFYAKNNTKKWLDSVQKHIDKKYDDIYFIRFNIGETYIELLHLSEVIKINGSKRPLLIVWHQKYYGFYKMFLPDNMDLLFLELKQATIDANFTQSTMIKHNGQRFICGTPKVAKKMKKKLRHCPKVNFYDYINESVGIKQPVPLATPKPSKTAQESVKHKINRMNLDENNFLILCPEASTLKNFSNEFWLKITKQLKDKGYDLFVNSYDYSNTIENVKCTTLTIEELFILTTLSKGVITLASGMAVFLTAAQVKMDLIYTDFSASSLAYDADLAMKIYSVYHIPNVSKELVKEYNGKSTKEDELIQQILSRY